MHCSKLVLINRFNIFQNFLLLTIIFTSESAFAQKGDNVEVSINGNDNMVTSSNNSNTVIVNGSNMVINLTNGELPSCTSTLQNGEICCDKNTGKVMQSKNKKLNPFKGNDPDQFNCKKPPPVTTTVPQTATPSKTCPSPNITTPGLMDSFKNILKKFYH